MSNFIKQNGMKRISIVVLTLMLSIGLMAETDLSKEQKKTARQQQLTELTNGYIQAFSLDEAKAATFRQVYADYNKQMSALKRLYAVPKAEEPTEEALENEILGRFNRQRAIIDLRLEYYHKLRKVLSPSQIQQIYDDEKSRKEKIQQ